MSNVNEVTGVETTTTTTTTTTEMNEGLSRFINRDQLLKTLLKY